MLQNAETMNALRAIENDAEEIDGYIRDKELRLARSRMFESWIARIEKNESEKGDALFGIDRTPVRGE